MYSAGLKRTPLCRLLSWIESNFIDSYRSETILQQLFQDWLSVRWTSTFMFCSQPWILFPASLVFCSFFHHQNTMSYQILVSRTLWYGDQKMCNTGSPLIPWDPLLCSTASCVPPCSYSTMSMYHSVNVPPSLCSTTERRVLCSIGMGFGSLW